MHATGFAGGMYALPILKGPGAPDTAALQNIATETLHAGRLVRNLHGSNLIHWSDDEVEISRNRIAHIWRLAPGMDCKLYLLPRFVETKEAFLQTKDKSLRVGDVKTFNGFIVESPPAVNVCDYNAIFIRREAFGQFISAAEYRPSRQANQ